MSLQIVWISIIKKGIQQQKRKVMVEPKMKVFGHFLGVKQLKIDNLPSQFLKYLTEKNKKIFLYLATKKWRREGGGGNGFVDSCSANNKTLYIQ